jgi:signal transduction histidine kinase
MTRAEDPTAATDPLLSGSWPGMSFSILTEIRNVFFFGVGVFFAYELQLRFLPGPAILWLPASVLFSTFLFVPSRRWWVYFLVGLCVSGYIGLRMDSPAGRVREIFPNDALQAVFSAWVLCRLAKGRYRMDTLSQFGTFVFIVAVISPTLSALADATVRHLPGPEFWRTCYERFLCDSATALVTIPTVIYWMTAKDKWSFDSTRKYVEAVFLACGLLLASYMAFGMTMKEPGGAVGMFYAPIPLLLWSAIRFGPIGASTATFVVGLLAMLGVERQRGPFLADPPTNNVLGMQLFLLVISSLVLLLAIRLKQRRTAEDELNHSYHEIRKLSASLLNAHDDERRRVSHELHDEVCQELTAVVMLLNGLKQKPVLTAAIHRDLDGLGSTISRLLKRIHGLSRKLHPSLVEYVGLSHALALLCRESESLYSVEIRFKDSKLTAGVSSDSAVCLFTVAQEALRNVARHSRSKHAMVELSNDEEHIRLRVRDWGCGFNVRDVRRKGGLGMIRVQERVRSLRGVFCINSAPGKGTELTVEMPLCLSQAF